MASSNLTDEMALEGNSDSAVTIIEPQFDRYFPDSDELWRFRNLFNALVWRNIRVRYKNTALGAFWILLQPLLQMLVYTMIFGIWARIPVKNIPYSIHVLSGLVLVFFLTRVLGESANIIRANQSLTRKVYFPKLILPIVLTASAIVDLGVALILLTAIMLVQGVFPSITVVLAPVFLIILIGWAFALSLWFSALGIRFRDVTLIVPVMNMLMMYMSPIIYPITIVPDYLLPIYALNPMVGIVTGFRWAVLGVEPFYLWTLVISLVEIVVFGLAGLVYFVRTERNFNDFL